MNLEEIKDSGLLEAYVVGLLSGQQTAEVEQHLRDYPELNSDLKDIQRSFRAYASANGVEPRPELRAEILKAVTGKNVPPASGKSSGKTGGPGPFLLPFILAALVGLGGIIWGFNKANVADQLSSDYTALDAEYEEYKQVCDSLSADNAELRAMMTTITNPGNRILQLTPTGNFAGTSLYLHTNAELQLNYIQAMTLPSIAANQAFQLWSLKDGINPIPMTVFPATTGNIFPVDFEEGTGTYAITIEDADGAEAPNLEQLIGTIKV